jgi:leucyl/phenylalanyl-tRNA--protein transferase
VVAKLLDTKLEFPPYHRALSDPDGLIAVGGKLTPDWLVTAYKNGIFPWSVDDDEILWWCPNERAVLVAESEFERVLVSIADSAEFAANRPSHRDDQEC